MAELCNDNEVNSVKLRMLWPSPLDQE